MHSMNFDKTPDSKMIKLRKITIIQYNGLVHKVCTVIYSMEKVD